MRNKFLIGLVSLFLGITSITSAQTRPLGRLLQVFDKATFSPIENAQLVDSLTGSYLMTNEQGAANLEFMSRVGYNKFFVMKIGYKPEEIIYTGVGADSPDTVVTVYLERVTTLAPSTTTATVESPTASFDQRVKAGFGRFLTPEELKNSKYENMSVGEAMRTLGVGASNRGPTSINGNSSCPTRTLVDGMEVSGPFLRSLMGDPIRRFQAVEFYPSGLRTPSEFQGVAGNRVCGVKIFWTKVPKG